tara:strand:- start:6420 stop:8231 length:1812 start_codon:yes stop_codon:yes gene_type:complete
MNKKLFLILLYFNNTYCFINNIYIKKLNLTPVYLLENSIPFNDKIFKRQNLENIRYSEFISEVENGRVKKTLFMNDGKKLLLQNYNNKIFKINLLPNDNKLMETLIDNNVIIEIQNTNGDKYINTLIGTIIYLTVFLMITQMLKLFNNNENFYMNTNEENLKMIKKTNVTFNDVVGIDSAKLELQEVVVFLKEEKRFTKLGAKIPRGILLDGPPGSGKTLLARAIAGESNLPFFSVSGSEFIELFIGTGSTRVRTLFKNAKKMSPSIIFIDEIDAIGKQRTNGMGNEENEQTLNQLLSEMDGFQENTGVMVIGATNRGDILDSALLRSGRFDRKIYIDYPDYQGRLEILKLYAKKKSLTYDTDLVEIAKSTPNFSGASLENLMNEAAILTVRNNETKITNNAILAALDKITIGSKKNINNNSLRNKELIAVHESGHAIIAAYKNNYDKVSRISIAQRGNNIGGLTIFTPDEDLVSYGLFNREYYESLIQVALGGRVAEELIFGSDEITTVAINDLEIVSSIARNMIVKYGMSQEIGAFAINENEISMYLQNKIDNEILKIIDNNYKIVKTILQHNIDNIKNVAKLLIEKENITSEEFNNAIKI